MSLKTFHLIFITVTTLMAFGLAGWAFLSYRSSASAGDLWFGISGVAAGIGLLVYGRYFLKKLKHISYL